MRLIEADGVFQDMVASESSHGVDLILTRDRDLEALVVEAWRSTYAEARRDGVLRSPLPDTRLIEGAASLGAMLSLRTDLDEADRRRFLQDFLVPALVNLAPTHDADSINQGDETDSERKMLGRSETLPG